MLNHGNNKIQVIQFINGYTFSFLFVVPVLKFELPLWNHAAYEFAYYFTEFLTYNILKWHQQMVTWSTSCQTRRRGLILLFYFHCRPYSFFFVEYTYTYNCWYVFYYVNAKACFQTSNSQPSAFANSTLWHPWLINNHSDLLFYKRDRKIDKLICRVLSLNFL